MSLDVLCTNSTVNIRDYLELS